MAHPHETKEKGSANLHQIEQIQSIQEAWFLTTIGPVSGIRPDSTKEYTEYVIVLPLANIKASFGCDSERFVL